MTFVWSTRILHFFATHPPEIFVNVVSKHIHAAGSYTQYVDDLFLSFIANLNEYFLISSLPCSFTNVTSYHQ